MIKQLDIANLKSFGTDFGGEPHEIEMAPVTLLYGPNSAGKSTIIQALSLLRELVGRDRTARHGRLPLRTPSLDLGSFRSAVHRHELGRSMYLGVAGGGPGEEAQYAGLAFRFDPETRSGVQHRALVGRPDERVSFTTSALGGHDVAPDELQRLVALMRDDILKGPAGEEAFRQLSDAAAAGPGAPPEPWFPISLGGFPALPQRDIFASREVNKTFIAHTERVLGSRIGAVQRALTPMSYLGPLRAAPSRLQKLELGTRADVGSAGELATRLLLEDPALTDEVNLWLKRLKIPYELSVAPVAVQENGDLNDGAIDVDDVVATTLVDPRNGIPVSPQDVGFGVSQILPLVVQCLVAKHSVICAEQPEVHIHPRLQTEVGDLLLQSAAERGNQLIIETHSEHLMRRIQRRIREAPDNAWLDVDKVAVVYVDVDVDGHALPLPMEMDDDGYFLEDWPGRFFAERLDEMYPGSPPPTSAGEG